MRKNYTTNTCTTISGYSITTTKLIKNDHQIILIFKKQFTFGGNFPSYLTGTSFAYIGCWLCQKQLFFSWSMKMPGKIRSTLDIWYFSIFLNFCELIKMLKTFQIHTWRFTNYFSRNVTINRLCLPPWVKFDDAANFWHFMSLQCHLAS